MHPEQNEQQGTAKAQTAQGEPVSQAIGKSPQRKQSGQGAETKKSMISAPPLAEPAAALQVSME